MVTVVANVMTADTAAANINELAVAIDQREITIRSVIGGAVRIMLKKDVLVVDNDIAVIISFSTRISAVTQIIVNSRCGTVEASVTIRL